MWSLSLKPGTNQRDARDAKSAQALHSTGFYNTRSKTKEQGERALTNSSHL